MDEIIKTLTTTELDITKSKEERKAARILYMSYLGALWNNVNDDLNHAMRQKLIREGKTRYMGQHVDLSKMYCCYKCSLEKKAPIA